MKNVWYVTQMRSYICFFPILKILNPKQNFLRTFDKYIVHFILYKKCLQEYEGRFFPFYFHGFSVPPNCHFHFGLPFPGEFTLSTSVYTSNTHTPCHESYKTITSLVFRNKCIVSFVFFSQTQKFEYSGTTVVYLHISLFPLCIVYSILQYVFTWLIICSTKI